MAGTRDEDTLEGDVGRWRRSRSQGRATFPKVSRSGGKRARAAWFNRPRGAGKVKLAAERDPQRQRVIVKVKPVVHAKVAGGGGGGGLMRHALYVERDGAGREGDPVKVFDRDHDRADGAGFVERCVEDRHHFRIIISPEFGAELEDLKRTTRELMRQAEMDLKCRLDWIAAEHHDTGRPHVHLLIRGRHEDGRDLVIPRTYIAHGLRHRAEEIVTRELGPRLEPDRSPEPDRRAERAAELERPTHLDEHLASAAHDQAVRIADLPAEARLRAALVQRLNRLEDWGLAQRIEAGGWRLDAEWQEKLVRLADTRDRERAVARLLAREDLGPDCDRLRQLEQAHSLHERVTGRLIGWEPLSSNARGPFLIALEGIDGRVWTARIGREEELRVLNGVERGAVVALDRAQPGLRPADCTIMEIAKADDFYSAERHRELRPADRDEYIQMHVRRLEALRRDGVVERTTDGRFLVPRDYEERVLARESLGGRESARIELLDPHPLRVQARYAGPTWLDRAAAGLEALDGLERTGFGAEAIERWGERQAFLKDRGLGRDGEHGLVPDGDWIERLREMEKDALLEQIERDFDRVAHIARDGERVEGVFKSRIHAAERSYALIVQDQFATLAPWRPEMDRALNQFVSGRVDGRHFDFKYGREVEKALQLGLGLGR